MPNTFLHFCGLKIWSYSGTETIVEQVEEPAPVKPVRTSSGKVVTPEPEVPQNDWIKTSSLWHDERNQPWNVIKSANFNAYWGQGDFTCVATLNDKDGPWWQADFGMTVTITKIQILNRGDCCGERLIGAKVFIGTELCGTIADAPAGQWIDVNCKASGDKLKI